MRAMTSGLKIENVRYGSRTGYLAYPARAALPLPGVVVIPEAWGVEEHIENVVRRVAHAGYVALAPDLLSTDGVRPEAVAHARIDAVKAFLDELAPEKRDAAGIEAGLTGKPAEQAASIRATLAGVFGQLAVMDSFVPALLETSAFLRAHEACRGQKVASLGFCMGGGLSGRLAAADAELAGAVIFYGSAPPDEQAAKIRCPLIGFYADADERINAGIPAFAAALAAADVRFERHDYPGAKHAFFNDTRPHYHAAAARETWWRTLGFLRQQLTLG
jgi:carboxymethylenebutenolidase